MGGATRVLTTINTPN